MKLYPSCLAVLCLVGSITGCSGSAPVEVSLTQQQNATLWSDGVQMTYMVITAKADQVTVKSAKINRGNSCAPLSWYGNGNLKYGQSIKASNRCDPDAIKEVTVQTDQGDYTFNF